jgi:hypothetical protein
MIKCNLKVSHIMLELFNTQNIHFVQNSLVNLCLSSTLTSTCLTISVHRLLLLTLSNPIFLPPAYSPALIYFGLERGWWITCPYYMRESVGQTPTAERENKHNKKMCRTSSDIGAEQENHNVRRGPTLDRKGLSTTVETHFNADTYYSHC